MTAGPCLQRHPDHTEAEHQLHAALWHLRESARRYREEGRTLGDDLETADRVVALFLGVSVREGLILRELERIQSEHNPLAINVEGGPV